MTITSRTSAVASDPTSVALEALAHLERAWNGADGAAFGDAFAPDASFVTIRGEHILGSAAIGAGHAGIFATIYAGSVNRMELVHATEIADGVVLAVSVNTLDCPIGPLAGRHQARSTTVIARSEVAEGGASTWQVVASHNTLLAS